MSETDLKDALANLTPFNDEDQLVFDAAVKRIEELEQTQRDMAGEFAEIDQILGKALHYPEADETIGGKPGKPGNPVITGEHVPVTLAMEAAKRIAELEAERDRLRKSCQELNDMAHGNGGWIDRITELEAEVERLLGRLNYYIDLELQQKARAEAAEAEVDRLRDELQQLIAKWRNKEQHHELSYGLPYCLHCIGEGYAGQLEEALSTEGERDE